MPKQTHSQLQEDSKTMVELPFRYRNDRGLVMPVVLTFMVILAILG